MSTYEVMIDNAKMQVHCHDEAPPADEYIRFYNEGTTYFGELNESGQIIQNGQPYADWAFPALRLEPGTQYDFEWTFAAVPPSNTNFVMGFKDGIDQPEWTNGAFYFGYTRTMTSSSSLVQTVTAGPGDLPWSTDYDDHIADWFIDWSCNSPLELNGLRYRPVGGSWVTLIPTPA